MSLLFLLSIVLFAQFGGVLVAKLHNSSESVVLDFTGKMLIPPKNVEYEEGRGGALLADGEIIDKQKL